MLHRILVTHFGVLSLLCACEAGPGNLSAPLPPGLTEPALVQTHEKAPPGAPEGSCWGKDITPAVIETVTERVLVQPAQVQVDGTVLAPPIYRRETRQAIVKERKELWFQTPCEDQLTPDFVSSLQRALKARGLYRGVITGTLDPRTRHAVRRFQAPQGLDSSILSLDAARKLGLVAVERPPES